MRLRYLVVSVVVVLLAVAGLAIAKPVAHAAATCSDYASQAAAQRAADTVGSDDDGIYCESLPCPCLRPRQSGTMPAPAPPARAAPKCVKSQRVVDIGISRTKYPAVLTHIRAAIAAGWPRVAAIYRVGAVQRRTRALKGWPTRSGYDRDEWPMAMARTRWQTHVAYVASGQKPRRWQRHFDEAASLLRRRPLRRSRLLGAESGIALLERGVTAGTASLVVPLPDLSSRGPQRTDPPPPGSPQCAADRSALIV